VLASARVSPRSSPKAASVSANVMAPANPNFRPRHQWLANFSDTRAAAPDDGMTSAAAAYMDVSMSTTRRIIWMSPDTTLSHAYELMRDNAIRHLPVVDGPRLVGMVSDRDLLLYANPVSDGDLTFPALPVSRIMSTEL